MSTNDGKRGFFRKVILYLLVMWLFESFVLPDKGPFIYGLDLHFWGVIAMCFCVICGVITLISRFRDDDQ